MSTKTRDNRSISITAHVKKPSDLKDAVQFGPDGIGLLEVSCPAGVSPDSAEEKYYGLLREAGEIPARMPVTVLLPDILGPDENPSPGLSGIRFFLSGTERYIPFLRALLRAGAANRFEIALPMVGQVTEIMAFKEIMGEVRAGLESEEMSCATPVAGVVVEVPSVIPAIKPFLFEAGFFMVGENYLKNLMADQGAASGERGLTAYYSQAFLLQLMSLVESLKGRKESARICAPAVRDPVAALLMIGLGIGHIVAPPDIIPEIRRNVESVNLRDIKAVASKTTSYWDPRLAREYAEERAARLRTDYTREKQLK